MIRLNARASNVRGNSPDKWGLWLFICALAAFSSCKQNRAPGVPAMLAGPDSCFVDSSYAFRTIAADPDGDSVDVRFGWGDSTFSDWKGLFPSGDTTALSHAWTDTGTYEVKAQARDPKLLSSGWSSGLTVRVVLPRLLPAPNAPAKPTGPSIIGRETSAVFSTVATHPHGFPVAIRFAWGDGDTSGWSSFVASGESVSAPHSWAVPDTYAITAQAKDTSSALSEWSSPCSIIVRPPDTLRKWRFRLATGYDMSLLSSPAIVTDGTIYVVSPDSALYAISPDGSLKWRYPANLNARSSPTIAADGTVYVGSNDGHLYAINPNGTLKWSHQFATADAVSSPSVALDSTIYCTSSTTFCSLSPDGAVKREGLLSNGSRTTAAAAIAAGGMVYLPTDAGNMYALYPDLVSRGFEYDLWTVNPTDLAIGGDGTIYVGDECNALTGTSFEALCPDSSLGYWVNLSDADVRSAPAIAPDGTVYFGSADHNLYAYSSDGTLKWRYETAGDVDAGPAVAADGTVYVGSDDYCLYAVNADGTLKWRYPTGGQVEAAPTIGTDGTIYFSSDDGYLYALNGTSPLANSSWPKFHHDLQNTSRAAGDGLWSRIDTLGDPVLVDTSGFTARFVNAGNKAITMSSLGFEAVQRATAYMRDFLVDGAHGNGYPIPNEQTGTGPGNTMRFAPVTLAPNRSQTIEFGFLDFHIDPTGVESTRNVVGNTFGFRFENGQGFWIKP